MRVSPDNDRLHPIQSLDLSAIDAVGFDLDHTLALYDDESVNRLAAEETFPLLNQRGYSVSPLPYHIQASTARGLSMDLRHGNVLKVAANGRVRLARCGDAWLAQDDIDERYHGYDPADLAVSWHVYSPFDTPTLWFFSVLGPTIAGAGDGSYATRLLKDIRTSLDASHTRGELKQHIARDLDRFVTGAGDLETGLQRWKHAGKKLFLITNSDRTFATRVLDHVLARWRDLFDIVVTDAAKPRFFGEAPPATWPSPRSEGAHMVHGANAAQVEARLGVPRERILYAGDNARADIMPAHRRGWKTVHVVAELSLLDTASPWAGALECYGSPTWFAKTIHDHADATCARVDALLACDPGARLDPTGDFFSRIIQNPRNRPAPGDAP